MRKVLVLIMVISLIFIGCNSVAPNSMSQKDNYIYKMNTFNNAVKVSCVECLTVGTMISSIWSDAISETYSLDTSEYVYDSNFNSRNFNRALSLYFDSEDYLGHYKNIINDKSGILELYTELNDLPDEYSSQLEYIKHIYDSYSLYVDSIISPSGTLLEFQKTLLNQKEILTLCDTLSSLIPPFEKEEYIFDNKEITQSFAFGLRKGTYTGKMINGKPEGEGIFISDNSEGVKWTYTGNFRDGEFSGSGKSEWTDGNIYEGEYARGYMNGKGKYTCSDGTIKEGIFKDGVFIPE